MIADLVILLVALAAILAFETTRLRRRLTGMEGRVAMLERAADAAAPDHLAAGPRLWRSGRLRGPK